MNRIAAAILLAALLATTGAYAQTVYRCGNTYSQAPCSDGKVVDVADPRTEAQRAQALEVAAADRDQARQYDRRVQWQAARSSKATILKPAAPVQKIEKTKPAVHARKKAKSVGGVVKPILPLKIG